MCVYKYMLNMQYDDTDLTTTTTTTVAATTRLPTRAAVARAVVYFGYKVRTAHRNSQKWKSRAAAAAAVATTAATASSIKLNSHTLTWKTLRIIYDFVHINFCLNVCSCINTHL